MDFKGPLYDVRMSRGQGYNSYIQEPRLYEAVKITSRESATVIGTGTKRMKSSEGHLSKPKKADPAEDDSEKGPALNGADYIRILVDELTQKGSATPKGDGVKKLPYLQPKKSANANQTVLFSSKQVKNAKEINDAMGLKASAAVKAATIGPGAELGSNISTQDDFKNDAVNFLVTVKVVNEKPDRHEDWKFTEVKGLKTRLSNIVCDSCKGRAAKETTDNNHSATKETTHGKGGPKLPSSNDSEAEEREVDERERAKEPCQDCAHKRAIEFTRIYGDTFISDFVEGGEIYALVNIRSSSKTKLNDLKVYASAQLTPPAVPIQAKIDTQLTTNAKNAWDQAETSIRVQWRGGGEIKTHDFQWGLESLIEIANAFPSFVATSYAKIRAVLTPYSALETFQHLQNIFPEHPLTLNYDRCALFVSTLYEDFTAFHGMWEELNNIIESPDLYQERKVAQEKELLRRKIGPTQLELAKKGNGVDKSGIDATDQAMADQAGDDWMVRAASHSSSSSLARDHQSADAGGLLSKLVQRTPRSGSSRHTRNKAQTRRRQAIFRPDFGQQQEAVSAHAETARKLPKSTLRSHPGFEGARSESGYYYDTATHTQQDNRYRRRPQETTNSTLQAKEDDESPVEDQNSLPAATAPGNASSQAKVSVEHVPGATQAQAKLRGTDPSLVLLTKIDDILTMKDADDPKLNPIHPNETQKLSKLRLVCRFAMLHIQDIAANLVIDPQETGVAFGRLNSGMPKFSRPPYPYPATIKAILPVQIGRAKPDYGAWHYTSVEDLRFPDFMKAYPGSPYPDDYTYWWDVFGDALSDYKKYKYFQIGNFNPQNEENPQAIALQANGSRIAGYFDKETRNDTNMISGIALQYGIDGKPSRPYGDLENQVLDPSGKKTTPADVSTGVTYTMCGGKPPAKQEQWKSLSWTADSMPFNRFSVYHKQGSGRVSGLEVYRDDDVDGDAIRFGAANEPEKKALLSHLEWVGKKKKPSPMPTLYFSVPGDGFSPQKLWMFAGFVGAFEKTGPFGQDRALAKLAIVWKRKASQTGTGDV